MPVSIERRNRIHELSTQLARETEALRAIGETYRSNRDAIKAEHEQLLRDMPTLPAEVTHSIKERLPGADDLARMRSEAEASIRERRTLIASLKLELEEQIQMANAEFGPAGSDGVAAQVASAAARQRVRSLVEQHEDPAAIYRQAAHLRDRETLMALRAELPWIAKGADTTALTHKIDVALIPLSPRDEGDVLEAAVGLRSTWPATEILLESAAPELEGGTMATAVAMRFAQQEALAVDDDENHPPANTLDEAVANHYADNGASA